MSDSDKALLAAAAMRAKKNAIDQGKGLSVTAKVKALSKAGFTDAEIDRIIAVEAEGSTPTATDTAEYNQQVDETVTHAKVHTGLMIFSLIGFFSIMFWPSTKIVDSVPRAIIWMAVCLLFILVRNIPFGFKKAEYFLKR